MKACNITKMLFATSGTYEDMAIRPYSTDLDARDINTMHEVTDGGSNITATGLAGVAGKVLRPTTESRGIAPIAHGWGERRLRFMLEAVTDKGFGHSTKTVITGYTEHHGVSIQTSQLDPQMRLYFNNVIVVRSNLEQGPSGRMLRQAVAEASHVITREPTQPFHHSEVLHYARPQDVVTTMFAQDIAENGHQFQNLATAITQQPVKSLRGNGNASAYLSKTLTALKKGSMDQDNGQFNGMESPYQEAKSMVRDPGLKSDDFFDLLMTHSDYMYQGSIAWGDFVRIFPEAMADHITKVFMKGTVQQQNPNAFMFERGATEHWHGTNHETVLATILAQAVPAIMMDLMITSVVFTATNRTIDGQPVITMNDAAGFAANVDMSPYLFQFQQRILNEVMRDITRSNTMDVDIMMAVDILGDTAISVSVMGGPVIHYSVPSFCDALITPVARITDFDLNRLATDIRNIHSNLTDMSSYRADTQPAARPIITPAHHGGFHGEIDSVI